MRAPLHQSGFSLVELLVAVLSATVLVLAAGAMIWHSQVALHRLTDVVDVHRDMRASMDVLARMTRPGTNFTFTTGLVYTVTYTNRSPARVYASGSNLFYDVNTAVAGPDVQLVYGTLKQFNVVLLTNQALVTLVLESPLDRMSNRVTLLRRN